MGMAASQARYLALAARQSNCEYEGQQINQARLVLSNQSANLFNQMLGLDVPVPPSTQDYTKTQYSYKDGENSTVIDSWKQLSTADPDYNYTVKAHYYTDLYTGSIKKMSDPQVQISSPGNSLASLTSISSAWAAVETAKKQADSKYNNWQSVKSQQEAIIANYKQEAQNNNKMTAFQSNVNFGQHSPGTYYDKYEFGDTTTNTYYDVFIYDDPNNTSMTATDRAAAASILSNIQDMVELGVMTQDELNAYLMAKDPTYYIDDMSQLDYDGTSAFTQEQINVLKTFGLSLESTSGGSYTGNSHIVLTNGLDDLANTSFSSTVVGSLSGYPITSSSTSFTSNGTYMSDIAAAQAVIDAAEKAYYDTSTTPPSGAKADYETALATYEALNRPTYIGNCELTFLDTLTDDQKVELQQVVKDMQAQGIDANINDCFDSNGNYLGGVYSFQLNGTTYYTTYQDLSDAYASNSASNNYIDAQYKMPYYNASYVSTKIEQEGKALLETDENGRFTSIRFENDSVKYVLNVETVTDDAAYQDAMNEYNYENAKYDKMIQDINAKTSLIQQEDQQLELRLKQLDTERNALKTEMDAVKEVVKNNVESTFKTFSN